MIVVWGWRTRLKELRSGTFACPSCRVDRAYSFVEARRWFTFFWIPLIPLKRLGQFVKCSNCGSTFTEAVLELKTTASLRDDLMVAVREAAVVVLGARPSAAAVDEALLMLTTFSEEDWHEEALRQDMANLDTSGLTGRLGNLAEVLNEHGKERLVSWCVRVGAAGGTFSRTRRATVMSIASDIGMTPAHARGVIDEVLEQQDA
jgi:hypothetical protein